MVKRRRKPAETTVALGSDLRIGRAREVFNMLAAAAASEGSVAIDGSEVTKVDAAGLQALVAIIVRYRTAGTPWRWHNQSAVLTGAAKLLALYGALDLK
jgi:anti-anti-sigma regulatory factor